MTGIGKQLWAMSLALAGCLFLLGSPALAEDNPATPIAGCVAAALKQQSRVGSENNFYKRMAEVAAYWEGQLAKIEPDTAQQAATISQAKTALEADLTKYDTFNSMMRVSQILGACRDKRNNKGG